MISIGLDDAVRTLGKNFGLVIGPEATMYPGVLEEMKQDLSSEHKVEASTDLLRTADKILESGVPEAKVRESICALIQGKKPSAHIGLLARLRLTSILSLSYDVFLEERLQLASDSQALSQKITIVDSYETPIPPRTFPSFKLLGQSAVDSIAFSSNSLRRRRIKWPRTLQLFADYNQGRPLLCVGLDDSIEFLLDILVSANESSRSTPSALFFLETEGILSNIKNIEQALTGKVTVFTIKEPLDRLVRAMARIQSRPFTPDLPFDGTQQPLKKLSRFNDIVAVVNNQLEPAVSREEHTRLIDLLFAPASTEWDPFTYDLDFKRDFLDVHEQAFVSELGRKSGIKGNFTAILRGSVSSGKTMAAKRLALNIAQRGYFVAWIHTLYYEYLPALRSFFADAKKEGYGTPHKPIVIFLDDPASFSVGINDIARIASSQKLNYSIHVTVRESDWQIQDPHAVTGDLPVLVESQVPDEFTPDEMDRLGQYLVSLKIFNDLEKATEKVRSLGPRSTDVLNAMFFLLPETRYGITMAIRDEYFRVGNASYVTERMLESTKDDPQLLQKAYAFSAVADHYRTPVPTEILVSALGVSYGDWINATRPDSLAWGILYDEQSDDQSTRVYRPRTSIITRVLMETINGSRTSKFGEVQRMKEMLDACTGDKPVFRNFCAHVLIKNVSLKNLDYDQGVILYEAALRALPKKDKAILHHYAIWIREVGRNPILAQRVLEEALEAGTPHYASRSESNENIHTTYAANAISAVELKQLDLDTGKEVVKEHLSKARRKDGADPYLVHIHAVLTKKLIQAYGPENRKEVLALFSETVGDVDRAALFIGGRHQTSHQRSEIRKKLKEVKEELFDQTFGHLSIDELKIEANNIWAQHKSQDGYVAVCRRLYEVGKETGVGSRFHEAYAYFEFAKKEIEKIGSNPSSILLEVGLIIYYHWQVRNKVMTASGLDIDWQLVEGLSSELLRDSKKTRSVELVYLNSLAKAHMGRWDEARVGFTEIRSMGNRPEQVWEPRDYLLNDKGGIRTLQGVVQHGIRTTVSCEALKIDFRCDDVCSWPDAGAVVHFNVQFCFGGDVAVVSG